MPAYEYCCATCGPFTEIRPMAEYALPAPCPGCGAGAPRQLISAPNLAGPGPAWQREAASRPPGGFPRHGGRCACCASPRRASLTADAPG